MPKRYTDEELVEEFWSRHDGSRREPSLASYRGWMRDFAPQLHKIMLDGLRAKKDGKLILHDFGGKK